MYGFHVCINLSTIIKCAESRAVKIVVLITGPRSILANTNDTATATTTVITAYIKSCGIDEDELSDDLVVKYETKVSGAIVSDAYRAGLLFNPVLK
jgi:hypothetical protein